MESILTPLLNSPKLPDYVAQLNKILADEEQKRTDFYEWLDENTKAEFLQGEILIHSPARSAHIKVLQKLQFIILPFVQQYNLGTLYAEQALIRLKRSDVMPDLCFWSTEKAANFTDDTTLFPVPDFIVEILSESTAANDRGKKKEEYALNGVSEYWIIDADKKEIEQFVLQRDDYNLNEKLQHGTVRCTVLHGLEIPLLNIFE